MEPAAAAVAEAPPADAAGARVGAEPRARSSKRRWSRRASRLTPVAASRTRRRSASSSTSETSSSSDRSLSESESAPPRRAMLEPRAREGAVPRVCLRERFQKSTGAKVKSCRSAGPSRFDPRAILLDKREPGEIAVSTVAARGAPLHAARVALRALRARPRPGWRRSRSPSRASRGRRARLGPPRGRTASPRRASPRDRSAGAAASPRPRRGRRGGDRPPGGAHRQLRQLHVQLIAGAFEEDIARLSRTPSRVSPRFIPRVPSHRERGPFFSTVPRFTHRRATPFFAPRDERL